MTANFIIKLWLPVMENSNNTGLLLVDLEAVTQLSGTGSNHSSDGALMDDFKSIARPNSNIAALPRARSQTQPVCGVTCLGNLTRHTGVITPLSVLNREEHGDL